MGCTHRLLYRGITANTGHQSLTDKKLQRGLHPPYYNPPTDRCLSLSLSAALSALLLFMLKCRTHTSKRKKQRHSTPRRFNSYQVSQLHNLVVCALFFFVLYPSRKLFNRLAYLGEEKRKKERNPQRCCLRRGTKSNSITENGKRKKEEKGGEKTCQPSNVRICIIGEKRVNNGEAAAPKHLSFSSPFIFSLKTNQIKHLWLLLLLLLSFFFFLNPNALMRPTCVSREWSLAPLVQSSRLDVIMEVTPSSLEWQLQIPPLLSEVQCGTVV